MRRARAETMLCCPQQDAAFVACLPAKGTLQEVVARAGHIEAAVGFALACAAHVRGAGGGPPLRVWVRQDAAVHEAGDLYGPALSAFRGGMAKRPVPESLVPQSLLPENLVIVRARTFTDALRAGLEAVRCAALDVVFIETVAAIDLTASRRLKLAAKKSGVAVILLRHAHAPASNAVGVRWQVGAASRFEHDGRENRTDVSRACFDAELVKHPAGLAGARWRVEWNDERQQFEFAEALPQSVDAIPVGRPLAT